MASTPAPPAPARKRTRSPAYPFINLETALERAKQFHDNEQRNAANVTVAATHWGFAEGSSYAAQTIASLIYFGLMQDEGTGDRRTVQLTQTALRILLDNRPDSQERAQLIKQAALTPKIHKQLWDKGWTALSDANLRHRLLFEWETPFNENAIDGFIAEYKSTIAFAKLVESDKITSDDGVKPKLEEENTSGGTGAVGSGFKPQIGDYVQWEPKGILQFPEPKRVTSISADGNFAFVEGSGTGLPLAELTPQQKPVSAQAHHPVSPLGKSAMRQDIFSLPEGTVTIQWPTPLSADSIQDFKDWLKIVERKVARSTEAPTQEQSDDSH